MGSLIMCLHGFNVVRIMGIDPREVKVGDMEAKIHHKGFDTHAQVWIKIRDEPKSGSALHNSSVGFSSFLTFPSINVSRFEERSEVPKVGDI